MDPIDLSRGWPSPSLLATPQIQAAANRVLSNPNTSASALLYGPDSGYQPLRESISQWLSSSYQADWIHPDRVCITGGASQSLACILQGFTDPAYTKYIWMISPTYFLASKVFEDNGFYGRLRAVPEDAEGLDIEYLRTALEKKMIFSPAQRTKSNKHGNKMYRHVIYVVPTFANPSGQIMSLRRRKQLILLARQHDALVIADDVYDHLSWLQDTKGHNNAILPRIVDIDHELFKGPTRDSADGFGNAISNGTFSKILGPGCRTGWVEASEKFIYGLSQVGSTRSGGAPSQLAAAIVAEVMNAGDLTHQIDSVLRPVLETRCKTMIEALSEWLSPLGVTWKNVHGGYFVWVNLPISLAQDFAVKAKEEANVVIAPGYDFRVNGDDKGSHFNSSLRLCFAWEPEARITLAIKNLSFVLKDMLIYQAA